MSNKLTALAPTLYSAAQEVSAEPFGAVAAINASFDDKQVAKGDFVKVSVAPTRAASDFTPAATPPEGDGATASDVAVEITKSRKVSWVLTGEQLRSLENGGDNAKEWARQMALQGMRTLRNEAERDCCTAIKEGASRAVGTAGTTPFASDINLIPTVLKVLKDNGAPQSDLQLVIDTAAGLNLRKLGIIQQAYQAGNEQERRSGALLRQYGFLITESAGIQQHTKGSGSGYKTNGAAASGSQDVAADTGTGTFVAGDIVAFADDANNKYVASGGLSGGILSLNRPGLLADLTDGSDITIGNNYTPSLAFERDAVVGIMRAPLLPQNPTMKVMPVSDAKGMTYLMVEISQYGQISWEIHLAWGFKAVQEEHIALILG